ncbi:hypothetical protein Q0N40_00725 [Corynebacterium pseudokroppenstedtii]|uniref:Uncharacterized protein n=1 Tax=Corynebacterium pseudokroppenstedtii TaxID=2804917 RepID=A0AAU0PZY2_9CORY|nr:hypothetical protein [Corynebacterium pseudokroppenstedtii]MBY0791282.1 hypothetical protein [Corynebacterium pseudokroppenstedtii]MCF6793527.1 hypothetical protein [Corynebacterium pseudokroppenstedtii]MCF8702845.1 hypothetical protein [Corynebacterium pseudokroppenstedtii]MCG2636556.1 hypothetical protein [Corynebacterium pseudokroppenstedtii]MDK7148234.1 hypothetical protein [Corynebacterium pseudokroppenstedtii]
MPKNRPRHHLVVVRTRNHQQLPEAHPADPPFDGVLYPERITSTTNSFVV